ncbi:MAG: hypothetical protein H6702_01820 [Myxococcales bacterium]|nr:hypothetical protein [Myxococcales bacterium]
MTDAREWALRARQSRDPAEADGFARRAVLAAPERPDGYLIRGQLAVHRRDVVAAAHHLRLAFARGARDAFTRDVLAVCLHAAGQEAFAAKMRVGSTDATVLAGVAQAAALKADAVRNTLSQPLPPPSEPGLLPGESAQEAPAAPTPAPVDPTPEPAPIIGAPPRPLRPTGNISLGPAPAGETRPPRMTGTVFRDARQTTTNLGASAMVGPAPAQGPQLNRRGAEKPSWLESTPEYEVAEVEADNVWLEDPLDVAAVEAPESTVHFEAGGIELAVDPGELTVNAVSPITGARMDPRLMRHDQGVMPDLGGPLDPLEARSVFAGVVDRDALEYAVRVPGPVLTHEGSPPKRLASVVGLALVGQMLVVRDMDRPDVPAQRLPLHGFSRVDVIAEGQQISFFFADGRGLHFDLRELRQRSLMVAVALVDTLVERIAALGQ